MQAEQRKKTKLCLLRDIYKHIREFETFFQDKYDLCLNEAMVICSLRRGKASSSEIAEKQGLSASNMSKVLKSLEEKNLIERTIGAKDKRQMFFLLSQEGEQILLKIKDEETHINDVLNNIFLLKELPTISVTDPI